ncbi:MAG: M15 family metallopeptidase [Verrucomicrobiae bacterium]
MNPVFDERTERNIATLHPKAQELARKFMALAVPAMREHGLEVRVIAGMRTFAEQNAIFAEGRTKPGTIRTNARGGYSWHCWAGAFDVGLFDGQAYLGDSPQYADLGKIGKAVGLEWGGSWKFCDEPHFQLRPPCVEGLKDSEAFAKLLARKASGQDVFS